MQLLMPFAPSASYAPSDFIRGEANEMALSLIERWPDWPYSIVLLLGESGSGKTHLCHVFAQRAHASLIEPARVGSVPADQLLTGNHAWVVDGLEQVTDLAGLAQLINHVRARGDYLLLTAQKAPSEKNIPLPDLCSRLLALPAITLHAPDDALLMGVLAKQFTDHQLRVNPEVLHFASQHIERSYSAAARFVKLLDALSMTKGRAVTIPLVREALQSSLEFMNDSL